MLPKHNCLFRWSTVFIKYFFLVTVGLIGAFLLAALWGHGALALTWMDYLMGLWWRLALASFLSLGCAVVFESLAN
jgi:hypothetical protein